RKLRRPSRSMVSLNTVCGSSPETKLFEETLCATKPVATRMARSGRRLTTGTASPTTTTGAPVMRPAQNFTEATPVSSRPAVGRVLAGLLRSADRRQRHHGNAGRRHVVVGHEEIRHQGHAGVDAVMLE